MASDGALTITQILPSSVARSCSTDLIPTRAHSPHSPSVFKSEGEGRDLASSGISAGKYSVVHNAQARGIFRPKPETLSIRAVGAFRAKTTEGYRKHGGFSLNPLIKASILRTWRLLTFTNYVLNYT